MSAPWGGVPAASFEFGLADHVGTLAFFVIGGLHRDVSTSFGTRDAIRASIVMLDGPEAGKEFEDILLFNSRIVSRFRNEPGTIVLGRIVLAEAKGGNNKPVELIDATPADTELAKSWYSYYPNKLNELMANVQASFQAEERKAAQTNQRPQSQPHPTHAGSQRPAWNGNNQAQPAQQAPAPGWTQQAQQQASQAAPWASGPAASREEAGY